MSADPRDIGERPDGAISGLLYDHSRRLAACRTHAVAEGHDVHPRAVLEGYDRALHPWVRGWRPGEIRETLAEKHRSLKQLLGNGGSTRTTTMDGDSDE